MRKFAIGWIACLVLAAGWALGAGQRKRGVDRPGLALLRPGAKSSCVEAGGEKSVQIYTRDGDSLGPHDMSFVRFPLVGEFNPQFATVKIAEHGCRAPKGPDDSCWVMKRILHVQYCQNGSRQMTGEGGAASQSATSMGSGAGCRQQS